VDLQVGQLVRALQMDPAVVLGRLSNDALLEIQQALCKYLDERFAEDRVEVVINRCFGGFGLSEAAIEEIATIQVGPSNGRRGNRAASNGSDRTHPALVATVKKLGKAANGDYAELAIVSVPRHLKWRISHYDGSESVVIAHPTSADSVRDVEIKE
jgi:hypothetical protein